MKKGDAFIPLGRNISSCLVDSYYSYKITCILDYSESNQILSTFKIEIPHIHANGISGLAKTRRVENKSHRKGNRNEAINHIYMQLVRNRQFLSIYTSTKIARLMIV